MKKAIKTFLLLMCAGVYLVSCSKYPKSNYVTLNEAIKSGDAYSLDLSSYGGNDAKGSITTQATAYVTSQVDCDASTGKKIYHFSTDSKTDTQEKVVINLENKQSGRCRSNEGQKTVVTINFTISKK